MSQMDQRAKLATQARPLIQKLGQGNFKSMMYAHLSELVGVTQREEVSASPVQYQEHYSAAPSVATPQAQEEIRLHEHVQAAICSLLQQPALVDVANEFELDTKHNAAGIELLDQLIGMINVQPEINTAQLIERLRDSRHIEKLSQLAVKDLMLEEDQYETYLRDTMVNLERQQLEQQIDSLLQQGLKKLTPEARSQLNKLYQRKAKINI
jgi:DNA primase